MGKFNLIEEPWIRVIVNETGETEEVSLRTVFANAHCYKKLAGEMVTQDFAIFRLLLAVLQTVFSRFDAKGKPYPSLELDERYRPQKELDEEEHEDYLEELDGTWEQLWDTKKFPIIIGDYLEKWRNRFNLLDEDYPFYQVTKAEIAPEKLNKAGPTVVAGKNFNRLISESNNKVAIFSPKYEHTENKEKFTYAQLSRWLIMLQGYIGLFDKVIFGKEKYKSSKGWLFDLGGVFLQGENLFESLLLNLILVHPEAQYRALGQNPCWEYTPAEWIQKTFLTNNTPYDLAALYTNWGRAVYLDPATREDKPISIEVVKLPKIDNSNAFVEPMTMWRWNKEQKKQTIFTPKKHQENQALWRSFGLLAIPGELEDLYGDRCPNRIPGVVENYRHVRHLLQETNVSICAVSMQDDGNATSWVPTDEIYDELSIDNVVLLDIKKEGWVPRIHEAILETKRMVERAYYSYLVKIATIRKLSPDPTKDKARVWSDHEMENMYLQMDAPFRAWLSEIRPGDLKDERVFQWKKMARRLVLQEAKKLAQSANIRDYRGIEQDGKVTNIATAYRDLQYRLNRYK